MGFQIKPKCSIELCPRIDLFDVLIGSLIVLLYRIHTVHCVIGAAIDEVNAGNGGGGGEEKSSSNADIHQSQLDALKVRSQPLPHSTFKGH